jgi:hypothetical protein
MCLHVHLQSMVPFTAVHTYITVKSSINIKETELLIQIGLLQMIPFVYG